MCVQLQLQSHWANNRILADSLNTPVNCSFPSEVSGYRFIFFGFFFTLSRYYYPNVRDQLVAKGMLPLSKLCAMVAAQRQHPDESQIFSLPLIPRTDRPNALQARPSGKLRHISKTKILLENV